VLVPVLEVANARSRRSGNAYRHHWSSSWSLGCGSNVLGCRGTPMPLRRSITWSNA